MYYDAGVTISKLLPAFASKAPAAERRMRSRLAKDGDAYAPIFRAIFVDRRSGAPAGRAGGVMIALILISTGIATALGIFSVARGRAGARR